jgi:Tol biopolymer transport system component
MVSCHERDPDWSHAGDRIVFTTDPIVNVCTVAPDGAGLDTVPGGYGPCWSPADDFFAAVGGIGGPYMYVFTISLVEGNRFFPTFELPNHSDPDWSPDGASLVFEHMGDIYVVPSSGGTPICLTSGFSGEAYDPAWSPDGQYIAFGGGWDVWAVHLGTGTFSRVTAGPGNNGYPAWSPDGSSIAFISDRSGTLDVWLVPWDAPTAAQRTTWGAVKAVFK